MNSAALRVGRLLEIRIDTGYRTAADVDAMIAVITAEYARLPPPLRSVVAVDWRRCPLMSSEASERHLALFKRVNPRVERSATLAARNSSVSMLQFVRLIRESQHAERRLFHEPDEMITWLSEVLTPLEIARLEQFLAEPQLRTLVHAFVRSECDEAELRVALHDAAPLYRDAPEAKEVRAAGRRGFQRFMQELLPEAPRGARALAAELIMRTLGAVGKDFSVSPRAPAEIEAFADAMSDMFSAYVASLGRG